MEKLEQIGQDIHTTETLIKKFGWEEYFIFSLMLLVSLSIGVFFAWRGQRTSAEFLLGGKNMGTFPMTMSLVASFMSAITLLGTPADIYQYGTQYCMLVLSLPLVMAGTVYIYLPVFWKLKVSTSYEYLEWRFNKAVRLLASTCFTVQMVLYMSIVVYTPALAMSQITGFNVDLACGVIFVVCIIYTTIGGIRAVMWTDTFQGVIMFGSFLAVIIKGNYDAGGAAEIFDRNYQSGRIELFNYDTSLTTRHTVWTMLIGGYFTFVSIYGINQTQVQRYISVQSLEQAVKAIWWNVLGIGSLLLICSYAGLVIFAYYDVNQCDPITSKLVDKPDQLFPLFVMQVMGDIPCIPGLFVAGVFSGALSTVSSGLNALAAVTMQDFILGGCNKQLTERQKIIISKVLAVSYGVLSYGVVFLVKYLTGVLEAALAIFGIVGGPVLGVFSLGMFFPWANSVGAFVGTFSSLVFTMWFGFGQTIARNYKTYTVPLKNLPSVENCPVRNITMMSEATPTEVDTYADDDATSFNHLAIYETSYMWFSAIPCLLCVAVGIVVSLLSRPQDPRTLNPDLISPAVTKLSRILPKNVKDYFGARIKLGSKFVPGERERHLCDQQITIVSSTGDNINAVEVQPNKSNKHVNHGYEPEGIEM